MALQGCSVLDGRAGSVLPGVLSCQRHGRVRNGVLQERTRAQGLPQQSVRRIAGAQRRTTPETSATEVMCQTPVSEYTPKEEKRAGTPSLQGDQPQNWRATGPRNGGHQPPNWTGRRLLFNPDGDIKFWQFGIFLVFRGHRLEFLRYTHVVSEVGAGLPQVYPRGVGGRGLDFPQVCPRCVGGPCWSPRRRIEEDMCGERESSVDSLLCLSRCCLFLVPLWSCCPLATFRHPSLHMCMYAGRCAVGCALARSRSLCRSFQKEKEDSRCGHPGRECVQSAVCGQTENGESRSWTSSLHSQHSTVAQKIFFKSSACGQAAREERL